MTIKSKLVTLASSAALLVAGICGSGLARAEEAKLTLDGSTTVGPIAKAFAEYYMQKNPGVNVTVRVTSVRTIAASAAAISVCRHHLSVVNLKSFQLHRLRLNTNPQ